MVVFPNCKINLGLQILQKRLDGFHDLETIFYPVALKDALEVVRSQTTTHCHMSGYPVAGTIENNLCFKAWQLLQQDFTDLPQVDIYLHKAIPMGAGLGGGSSDGAFMLELLNEKFQLQCSKEQLKQYALKLGSDCPFFIDNTPCIGRGRGELLQPVALNLEGYYITLIHPGIHVNTGWAFSQLQLESNKRPSLEKIIQEPIDQWKDLLSNDFEEPVFNSYPEIANIKQSLYNVGAKYAAMSGSGSTVFGIFDHPIDIAEQFAKHYIIHENIPLGAIH